MIGGVERTAPDDRLYTRQFFEVFAAVTFFMTGFALQFHFGQYIQFVGHDVSVLGRILSISMIGTLAIRFHIGRWIDRFGCRPTWMLGTLTVAVSVAALQFTTQLWLITVLRTISMMAFAAVMTTVAVFAAYVAPPQRRAESLGTIGLGGFLGILIGPTLGDWIFDSGVETILPYRIFFSASAVCSLLAGAIMLFVRIPDRAQPASNAARHAVDSQPGESVLRVVLRNWPGMILLVGMVFSVVFALQMSFLERLAERRGFDDIKLFFLCYAPTAIALRIALRRLPQRFGRGRTVVLGMSLIGVGLLFLVGVDSQLGLIVPGVVMGAGHCFVFPSKIDLAAGSLPAEHRGIGTSLIMGAGDLGMLIGFAAMGEAIQAYGFDATLRTLAIIVLATAALFGVLRPSRGWSD